MIGMALFAVLMCVNFASCGGSDDEPTKEKEEEKEEVVTQGKKLVEMTEDNGSYLIRYNFSYDNIGKLNQLTWESIEEDGKVTPLAKYLYKWSDNQIVITVDNMSGFKCTCNLENNIITSIEENNFGSIHYSSFTYYDDKEIYEFKYGTQSNTIIHNIYSGPYFSCKQPTQEDYSIEYKIEYQNTPNHSWIDFESLNMDAIPLYVRRLILAHTNLLGKSYLPNLPKKIAAENAPDYWNFTFNTDNEKYVEKCKISTQYNKDVTTYTYKWE